jgi:hypothetical protein
MDVPAISNALQVLACNAPVIASPMQKLDAVDVDVWECHRAAHVSRSPAGARGCTEYMQTLWPRRLHSCLHAPAVLINDAEVKYLSEYTFDCFAGSHQSCS